MDEHRRKATAMDFDSDYTTLWEFLKQEKAGEEKIKKQIHQLQKQLSKKLAEEKKQWEKQALEDLYRYEKLLADQNIRMSEEDKKRYLLELERQKDIEQKKQLMEYWKMYSEEAKKQAMYEEQKLNEKYETEKKIFELQQKAARLQESATSKQEELAVIEAKIQKTTDDKEKAKLKEQANELKRQIKIDQKAIKAVNKEQQQEKNYEGIIGALENNFSALGEELSGKKKPSDVLGEDIVKVLKGIGKTITEGLSQINDAMKTYAGYQLEINTRLQGVGDFSKSVDVLSDVSYSPLIKTTELYENLSMLVAEGIASNVEQRAFLQTVSKGVATTFDANDSTLRRLIRLQQYDSTAARLGMEAFLNKYMNELVSNTEYLNSTFDSVANSLLEASSLFTSAKQSAEFEYIVQKWLGVLSGVGLSETSATNISQAIGYLGSGNIEGLASSGVQNLLVMAASQGGQDIGEMLKSGIDASQVNTLLKSIVEYLQTIGSSENRIVLSELAQTFGVTVSDIQAAKNIDRSTLASVYGSGLTYSQMYKSLKDEMNTLVERVGIANILDNLFANYTFSTGMTLASNPITYATWKITDLIQSVTGGINIPYITAAGFGIDLETTVENLVKLGLVGISTLGGIGNIVKGVASVIPGLGSIMLSSLGISENAATNILTRGKGLSTGTSGTTSSFSSFVSNVQGSDYSEGALAAAKSDASAELAEERNKEENKQAGDKLLEMFEEIDFYNRVVSLDNNVTKISDTLKGTLRVELSGPNVGDILGLT